MEEHRIKNRLETEVGSLSSGQERILKKTHEMFSAMNSSFDQLVTSCGGEREVTSANQNRAG